MNPSSETGILPPIAIVGISVDLPSGTHSRTNLDFSTFERILLDGKDVYEKFPDERLNIRAWKGSGLGQISTDTGAFIKNLALFDHFEFGISSKDAKAMSVGCRKLIEQSFLALLDSGIDYRGQNVGCFMSAVDFDISNVVEPDEFEARGSFAGAPCMIANRISYHLDLLGPSIPVDTACSSSLTATHLAVQALRQGDCDSAIVGGCQINHRFIDWINYSQGSILSPEGRSKPFDESANGFGRGEGSVVVVLKLLKHAVRDGDHIYASILGTGINSSGSKAPVSAPVAESQFNAMLRAYSSTGRSPAEADFIEMHATGTAAGDPTEANWVGKAFRRSGEILIGSVKGNIGHLEIAAFLASLAKVCSIFRTGTIPPTVNFSKPNPAIKWDEHRLRVVTETCTLTPLHPSGRALVSIASSGIGGSNGHAVVEAYCCKRNGDLRPIVHRPVLIMSGGLTPRSVSAISENLINFLKKSNACDLPMLSAILGRRVRQMTWRSFAIARPGEALSTGHFSAPILIPRKQPPVVFLFPGQGPQHFQMGRQLFEEYPTFRETVVYLDHIYEQDVGQSLLKTTGLFDSSISSAELPSIWPISVVLPAIAMIQIALVDLLHSFNIIPDIVIGHSAGETTVLYASGAGSKEMAFSIAVARGKAMTIAEKTAGTMAALSCSPDITQSIIDSVGEENIGILEVACFNTPNAVTIAGSEQYVIKAVDEAKRRGYFATLLRTRVPVHCSMMDDCAEQYRALMNDVFEAYPGPHHPKIETFSTLTGGKLEGSFTAEYFWENARNPVRFTEAISSLLDKAPNATFVEISPHPVLSNYLVELGSKSEAITCPMHRTKTPEDHYENVNLLKCLGTLLSRGLAKVDVSAVNGIRTINPIQIALPPYPFLRRQVPYHPEHSVLMARQLAGRTGALNDQCLKINSMTHPVLAEHVIKGEPIMPASGYLEMMFERGAKRLWDVDFHSMFSLSSAYPALIEVELDGLQWSVKSTPHSRSESQYRVHAEGLFSTEHCEANSNMERLRLSSVMERCSRIETTDFYDSLDYFANYGPTYRRIVACYKGEGEVLTQVRGKSPDLENLEQYVFHPAVFDSCLHVVVHRIMTRNMDNADYYLPSHIDNVFLHDSLLRHGIPEEMFVHVTFHQWHPEYLSFNFNIVDNSGSSLCSLNGVRISRHRSVPRADIQHRYDIVTKAMPERRIQISRTEEQSQVGDGDVDGPWIFPFRHGDEMNLKQDLSRLDKREQKAIWLFSSTDEDSAAAKGFSRSLRREMPFWDIRLVIFPREWTVSEQRIAIRSLSMSGMPEIEITVTDKGDLLLPRVALSQAPKPRQFNAGSFWYLDDKNEITQVTSHAVPDDHAVILIEAMSDPDMSLRGIVGRIQKGRRSGTRVIGVVKNQLLSNYAIAHDDQIVPIDGSKVVGPELALGALIVHMAFGPAITTQLTRIRRQSILVTSSASAGGRGLRCILRALEIPHDSLEDVSPNVTEPRPRYDLVLSGSTRKEEIQVLNRMSRTSSAFLWNDPTFGSQATLDRQPWIASDSLNMLDQITDFASDSGTSPLQVLMSKVDISSANVSWKLFDSCKAYILIGGIGSLGVAIAVWMYKHGARNIVMTSRNGLCSTSLRKNENALRMLDYLHAQGDMSLRAESCDATSKDDTVKLLSTIQDPIGGCMLLSGLLSDMTFFAQTAETYEIPFFPKVKSFKVLEEAMDIGKLDFFVSFSSCTIFGSAGQTNYSSANTLLDELTRQYPNAFSFVVPAILDSTVVLETPDFKLANLLPWAMTAETLCNCLEDGIRKLADGPFDYYIPDFDWNVVRGSLGSSPLYDHLAEKDNIPVEEHAESIPTSLEAIVLSHIGISAEDLSPDIPLTSYGLDSLSAARLSFDLRPLMSISDLQLLADITFNDLVAKLTDRSNQGTDFHSRKSHDFDWSQLNKSGETIVRLRDLDGNPLILIHGASGNILAFKSLQERFSTALWAVQMTPETPFQSIHTIARFYFEQIKKEQPKGPYRIGGFSGTCLITLEIVRLMESNGDEIVQLIFLDHFPLLFCSPLWTWDEETLRHGKASYALVTQQILVLRAAIQGSNTTSRHKAVEGLMDAVEGKSIQPNIRHYFETLSGLIDLVVSFLLDLADGNLDSLKDKMAELLQRINAQAIVYIASAGIRSALTSDVQESWADFGAGLVGTAKVVSIEGDHFRFLESAALVSSIEDGWREA